MLAAGTGPTKRIFVLKQLSADELAFAEHYEAGNLRDRNRDRSDPFKYVLVKSVGKVAELTLRKVFVSPDGRLMDPGPRK